MNEIEENTIARNKYNGSIEEARISQEEDLPKLNEIIHKIIITILNIKLSFFFLITFISMLLI